MALKANITDNELTINNKSKLILTFVFATNKEQKTVTAITTTAQDPHRNKQDEK